MIQRFATNWTALGRRRVGILLLAISLNLAIVPCTMALEVIEKGHDCCPPEIQLESSECCELGDASVATRSGLSELDSLPDLDTLPASTIVAAPARRMILHMSAVDPPDPPDDHQSLHKLNCVYLN